MRNRRMVFALAATILAACGDSYSSGPADRVLGTDYSGTFNGTVGSDPLTSTITFRFHYLLDDDDFVGGTYTTDGGWTGTINGHNNGSTVSFNFHQGTPCFGEFSGTASIESDGDRLTGTFTGTSPCTGGVSATFVVDRE